MSPTCLCNLLDNMWNTADHNRLSPVSWALLCLASGCFRIWDGQAKRVDTLSGHITKSAIGATIKIWRDIFALWSSLYKAMAALCLVFFMGFSPWQVHRLRGALLIYITTVQSYCLCMFLHLWQAVLKYRLHCRGYVIELFLMKVNAISKSIKALQFFLWEKEFVQI
jgi:hypothetical protein